jgi:multifunctional methyltransferase subunit TRM112
MRLLTHNTLRNNSGDAKGKGFPLEISSAVDVQVIDNPHVGGSTVSDRDIDFVKRFIPTLDWPALVSGASQLGINTLPPKLTDDLIDNDQFLRALYHILMNVHLINGMLKCPVTGREFPVTDGIPNMMLEEEECEKVRL